MSIGNLPMRRFREGGSGGSWGSILDPVSFLARLFAAAARVLHDYEPEPMRVKPAS
jgi:hypothetical protein